MTGTNNKQMLKIYVIILVFQVVYSYYKTYVPSLSFKIVIIIPCEKKNIWKECQ